MPTKSHQGATRHGTRSHAHIINSAGTYHETPRSIPLDILQELGNLTPSFDLEALIESSIKSFKSFRSFYENLGSSNDPNIMAIMDDIKSLFIRYCDAIDESMHTAQSGYIFATDGVQLCDFIKNRKSVATLTSFIDDMVGLAKEAAEKAELTVNEFRSIRTALLEIFKSIPRALAMHDQNRPEVGPSSPQFPNITDRLLNGIMNLEDSISNFASWWIETETKLSSVHAKARQLNPRKVNKLRLKTVRSGWVDVQNRYLSYKTKIARLRDVSRAEHNLVTQPAPTRAAEQRAATPQPTSQGPSANGSVPHGVRPKPPQASAAPEATTKRSRRPAQRSTTSSNTPSNPQPSSQGGTSKRADSRRSKRNFHRRNGPSNPHNPFNSHNSPDPPLTPHYTPSLINQNVNVTPEPTVTYDALQRAATQITASQPAVPSTVRRTAGPIFTNLKNWVLRRPLAR